MKTVRFVLPLGALLAACTQAPATQNPAPSTASPVMATPPSRPAPTATATATLRDASGKQVGTLSFADTYAGVLITGAVNDLGLGAHGIHIHAVGKCEAPFTTAGGHFNPTNHQHGYKSATGPHAGDLPNLDLPAAGSQRFEMLVADATLRTILDADGAAVVVHAARDDYMTDPAGNSGGRIACGVITGH